MLSDVDVILSSLGNEWTKESDLEAMIDSTVDFRRAIRNANQRNKIVTRSDPTGKWVRRNQFTAQELDDVIRVARLSISHIIEDDNSVTVTVLPGCISLRLDSWTFELPVRVAEGLADKLSAATINLRGL